MVKAQAEWLKHSYSEDIIYIRLVESLSANISEVSFLEKFKKMTSGQHSYKKQLKLLSDHYAKRVALFGDSAEATQWPSTEAQERRLRSLIMVCDQNELNKSKILDFGCGTAHLLTFLHGFGFEGEYVGFDICSEMIETAKTKFPTTRFEVKDVLAEPINEEFDYVFISGVFNNKIDDNWNLMRNLLNTLFACCRKGMAFNNLSRFVDFMDDDYFYADPMKVFQFCKENLSPLVTLKHDYLSKPDTIPFEFTTFVYSTTLSPKKLI